MIHHGLEKLQDPQGFSEFVVAKYFSFLPGEPIVWTFAAGITQIICPIGLASGSVHHIIDEDSYILSFNIMRMRYRRNND